MVLTMNDFSALFVDYNKSEPDMLKFDSSSPKQSVTLLRIEKLNLHYKPVQC